MEPTPAELRVLGSLLEKQRTTPDAYPLTLNALRLACNQSTNRDPVVDYDEPTIRESLDHLIRRRWARAASGAGSRAAKFRHLFDETLSLARDETAVLTVLMLRGPQTVGELKGRAERLHAFAELGAVIETLERLRERELVEALGRRPGEKQERWRQLVGGDSEAGGATVFSEGDGDEARAPAATPPSAGAPSDGAPSSAELAERLAQLEREVTTLRTELTQLHNDLGA